MYREAIALRARSSLHLRSPFAANTTSAMLDTKVMRKKRDRAVTRRFATPHL